jgi:hypothetical protein
MGAWLPVITQVLAISVSGEVVVGVLGCVGISEEEESSELE